MGKPEGKIENYLRKRVKEEGGQIRKVKWIGRKGAADDYLWFAGGRAAWCECKAEGVEVDWRSLQGREITRMQAAGIPVYVLNCREAVDAMIRAVKHG